MRNCERPVDHSNIRIAVLAKAIMQIKAEMREINTGSLRYKTLAADLQKVEGEYFDLVHR